MKRILLLFGILLAAVTVQLQAQVSDCLSVYTVSGTQWFALDKIQKITFSDGDMNIAPTTGDAARIAIDDVLKMAFEQKDFIDVPQVEIDYGVNVYSDGNSLIVESTTEISTVSLFDMQGRLLQNIAPGSLSATLDFTASSAGVYVVLVSNRQGTSAHKVVKH